jgi:hypothetical protein
MEHSGDSWQNPGDYPDERDFNPDMGQGYSQEPGDVAAEFAAYGATTPEGSDDWGDSDEWDDQTADTPDVIIETSYQGGVSSSRITISGPNYGDMHIGPGTTIIGPDGQALQDGELPPNILRINDGSIIHMTIDADDTVTTEVVDPIGDLLRSLRERNNRTGDTPEEK